MLLYRRGAAGRRVIDRAESRRRSPRVDHLQRDRLRPRVPAVDLPGPARASRSRARSICAAMKASSSGRRHRAESGRLARRARRLGVDVAALEQIVEPADRGTSGSRSLRSAACAGRALSARLWSSVEEIDQQLAWPRSGRPTVERDLARRFRRGYARTAPSCCASHSGSSSIAGSRVAITLKSPQPTSGPPSACG